MSCSPSELTQYSAKRPSLARNRSMPAERDRGAGGRGGPGYAALVAAPARPAGGHQIAVHQRADLDLEGKVVEGGVALLDHPRHRPGAPDLLGTGAVGAGLADSVSSWR